MIIYPRNTSFGKEFIKICDEIISFKDSVKNMLSELTVDLSYQIQADEIN